MSIAILYHPGLNTDLSSDLCGAKPHLMALAAAYAVHPYILAWDDPHASEQLRLLSSTFDYVLIGGHSHGAWRTRESIRTLQYSNTKRAKLGVFLIDLCPWGNPFEHLGPPESFPECDAGFACWQSHPRLFMPNGVKFQSRESVATLDCTDLAAPNLGHIDWYPDLKSIAGDARVWERIGSMAASLIPPAPVSPATTQATAETVAGGISGGDA